MQGGNEYHCDFSGADLSMNELCSFRPVLKFIVHLSYMPTLVAQIKYSCNRQGKIMSPWKLYNELVFCVLCYVIILQYSLNF